MAQGDVTVYQDFVDQLGKKVHNFPTDTLKLGIITNATPPTAADNNPSWTLYSANEVSDSGGYTVGGVTLTGVTWVETGGTATLDDSGNISLAQNASGFVDGYWGILYNDTVAGKNAIAFIDLAGPASEQSGPINITWGIAGILVVAS